MDKYRSWIPEKGLLELDYRKIYDASSNRSVLNSFEYISGFLKENLKKCFFFYDGKEPVALLAYERKSLGSGFSILWIGSEFGTMPLIARSHEDDGALIELIAKKIASLSNFMDAKIKFYAPNNKALFSAMQKRGFKIVESFECRINVIEEAKMFSRINRKCRNMVRKGAKNNLSINWDEGLEDFLKLYSVEDHYSAPYIKEESRFFKKHMAFVGCYRGSEHLSSAILFILGDEIKLRYLVSSKIGNKLAANNFLVWEILRRYKGMRLDLGGLGHEVYGQQRSYGAFKLSFSPEVLPRPYLVKINPSLKIFSKLNSIKRIFSRL
jgi:hypothetical protein